jgi:aspartate aminotransferase
VLGAGEPDFDTPEHIKEAAYRAMRDGATKYTALDGAPELKDTICAKFLRENNLQYRPNEIIVCAGAKQVIFNALMATLDEGDEVVLPSPHWVSYPDIVKVCGGRPVFAPCTAETSFKLTSERLEAAITSKTRWLILNSPSNPTGAAYEESEYRVLLDVLRRHPNVWVLSDDIYEHIIYDGLDFVTPAAVDPELRARTLTVNGVSKAYAMTGWRLGYAGGPSSLIKAMAVVQSQSTSCPSSISQAAAIAALAGPQNVVSDMCRSFKRRRDLSVAALKDTPGLQCSAPKGAFYVFPSCAEIIRHSIEDRGRIASDVDFCEFLLNHADVGVVPGSAFGVANHFRISYAASEAELREAFQRIARACERLQRTSKVPGSNDKSNTG